MVSFQRMKDELNDVENQVSCVFLPLMLFLEDMRKIKTSMPIKSSGRIVPPGWAPLQPKQSVLSLIV